MCTYFAKTAFFRVAVCDWCKQPCGVQQEAQQTFSLPLWRQQMHVGEIWCTGWENPSLGMVMKERRRGVRGRRGRVVLHHNSLSKPSSPTSMKKTGPHWRVRESGVPFTPTLHLFNDFETDRHLLMDSAKCLQLWFVWMSFILRFLLPSAASEAKHLNNASEISSAYWLREKGLCKWIQSILLHSSVQWCSWRMCYLNKS